MTVYSRRRLPSTGKIGMGWGSWCFLFCWRGLGLHIRKGFRDFQREGDREATEVCGVGGFSDSTYQIGGHFENQNPLDSTVAQAG